MATSKQRALELVNKAERVVVRTRITLAKQFHIDVTKEAAITAINNQYQTAKFCVYEDHFVEGLVVIGAKS